MPDKHKQDKTWYYAKPCMMRIIEISTGIVCTCLPTMRISIKEALSSTSLCFGFGSGCCCARSTERGTNTSPGEDVDGYHGGGEAGHMGLPTPMKMKKIHADNTSNESANLWRPGPMDGCHTEITRCLSLGNTTHWPGEERISRQILVTEEIDVELRAVERNSSRSSNR